MDKKLVHTEQMVIPLLIMTNMVVKLVVIGKTYYSLKLSEC